MRVVAIVQARLGSTRLPGKVLMDIAGRPMLARVIERLRRCHSLDRIVITVPIMDERLGIHATGIVAKVYPFVGNQDDVLSRYVEVADAENADVIVRITADCPLIDPTIVDAAVAKLTADPSRYDFVSNGIRRTYPKGLDVEVFFRDVLERVNRMATSPVDREHVATFMYRTRPDLFRLGELWDEGGDYGNLGWDPPSLNWSVDTQADLDHVRRLYADLDIAAHDVGYREIIAHEYASAPVGARS